MTAFCTLFDSHYMSRGIAMARSLSRCAPGARLYIFAFDDLALRTLRSLELAGVTVISLHEFETTELRTIKDTRTKQEYCWTCTPYVIAHVLDRLGEDVCVYIDADLYFYEDPVALLEELDGHSVLITPHWYAPRYNVAEKFGVYCVQFVAFRNTAAGRATLEWWRAACRDWCYNRREDGKFGDQKYLDDWPERFEGVRVLSHRGGGVAPWNVQQYSIEAADGQLAIAFEAKSYPIVFYHYHHVRFYRSGVVDLGVFELPPRVLELLYRPYISALGRVKQELIAVDPSFATVDLANPYSTIMSGVKYVARRLIGHRNFSTLP